MILKETLYQKVNTSFTNCISCQQTEINKQWDIWERSCLYLVSYSYILTLLANH